MGRMEREMVGGGRNCSPDWSALPGELLASIRGRLPPADFARFAAVCTAWRRSGPSSPARQLPWLMVPPSPSSSSSSPGEAAACCFFSPSEGKTYFVSVPELRGARCVGSCQGWVASFDGAAAEISMVNPLTRARITLPSPLTAMPGVTAVRDGDGRIIQYRFHRCHSPAYRTIDDVYGLAKKVVMSSAATGAACKLAATFYYGPAPVFVAVGGEKWAVAALGRGRVLTDIFYHGGDGKFYGLNYDDVVFRWHADDAETPEFYCRPPPDLPRPSYRYDKHLVSHLPSGDLLLILVDRSILQVFLDALERRVQEMGPVEACGCSLFWRQNQYTGMASRAVKAFRCKDDDGSTCDWQRLEGLSGCSLFLGKNQSICLTAGDVPELRADCIFLINRQFWANDPEPRWTQLWVYDLKEGVLEPYCPYDWQKSFEEPLWFMPNLS